MSWRIWATESLMEREMGFAWWADDAQMYGMDGCGSTWGLCTRWDYWLVRLYVPPGMGDMRVEWRQPE
jgi:hypothetical protein